MAVAVKDAGLQKRAKLNPQRGDVFSPDSGLSRIVVSYHMARGENVVKKDGKLEQASYVGYVASLAPELGIVELPLSDFQTLVALMALVDELSLPEHFLGDVKDKVAFGRMLYREPEESTDKVTIIHK